LEAAVGRPWVLCSEADREAYSYDAGTVEARPDSVVLPADRDQLVQVVKICHSAGVPVVPRGAGTSLSGGPVAVRGGVVVSLCRLNRLLCLDFRARVAVVEPGLVNARLQQAAAPHGLGFAPDPSSAAVSTLGGNAAVNASGPRGSKTGATGEHVLGIEFLLSDGRSGWTGRRPPVAFPAPPAPVLDVSSLLVGSEGTLAFLTRLALRLTPRPAASSTILAFFPSAETAGLAVARLVALGLEPSALELMGRLDVRLAGEESGLKVPPEAEAMLLIEFDGPGPALPRQTRDALREVRDAGAIWVRSADNPGERELLWAARRASTGLYGKLRPASLSGDVSVPRPSVPRMFRKIADLAAGSGLPIGLVGHAADGNLHPSILFDPRRPHEVDLALRLNREMVLEAMALGGSVTGEHGIGAEKLEFVEYAFTPATVRYFQAVKRAFDPRGLLNPGKVIPDPGLQDQSGPTAEPAGTRRREAPGRALTVLGELLGSGLIIHPKGLARYGFGEGRCPLAVALPRSTEELAETVRAASSACLPIWPVGSGSLARTAFLPFDGGIAVSTAALTGVLEIWPENLTVTVQAGCNAGALEAALDAAGAGRTLFYPVDTARGDRSTLGAEVAVNASGPWRPRYGATRGRVLGLAFVDADGGICRTGGRTVKDVSGYDVTRWLCGSWGVFGIVADATLRLAPRPESERTVLIEVRRPEDLGALVQELYGEVECAALQLLSPDGQGGPWKLLVGICGAGEDIDHWTARVVALIAGRQADIQSMDHAEAAALWDEARRRAGLWICRAWAGRAEPWMSAYIQAPAGDLPAVAGLAYGHARNLGFNVRVSAGCAGGTMDLGAVCPPDAGRSKLAELSRCLTGLGPGVRFGLYGASPGRDQQSGLIVDADGRVDYGSIPSCDPYPSPLADLLWELKDRLDPGGILAPGSLVLPPRSAASLNAR
jgi:glycolate oxidase subunit GlcD